MNKTYIIAEAGVNHNGDISTAKKMIDVAVKAGADAVKFQTFRAEQLVCQSAKKADYQIETTDSAESQFEMLKKLELSYSDHVELIFYCKKKNIQFFGRNLLMHNAFHLNILKLKKFIPLKAPQKKKKAKKLSLFKKTIQITNQIYKNLKL